MALVGWESITFAEKFSRRISHFIFNWEKCLSFWTSQFFCSLSLVNKGGLSRAPRFKPRCCTLCKYLYKVIWYQHQQVILNSSYDLSLCLKSQTLSQWQPRSGIISLIGCGLIQAHYAFKNISGESLTTVNSFSLISNVLVVNFTNPIVESHPQLI